MKVSDITDEMLQEIVIRPWVPPYGGVAALAQAELDRRSEAKPEYIVKFYKHGTYNLCFTKTVDGLIAESHGVEKFDKTIGVKLKCNTCLNNEITEEEYENARSMVAPLTKPAPEVERGEIGGGE